MFRKHVNKFFYKFFSLESKELILTQFFLFYLITVSVFAMIVLTIGESLFLSHYSQKTLINLLPANYICIALSSIIITNIYNRCLENVSRFKLIIAMDVLFAVSVIIFRQLLDVEGVQSWIYFVLLIWLDAAAGFKILLFYSYAGDYFTFYEAKRVYGYITNGMPLGALAGGVILTFLFQYVSVPNSLYFCVIVLFISSAACFLIKIKGFPKTFELDSSEEESSFSIRSLIKIPYIRLIFLTIGLSKLCWALTDYLLLRTANEVYSDDKQLAEFFIHFFSTMGALQLFVQSLLAARLLRKFGVIKNLLILPSALLITSLLFSVKPSLILASAVALAYLTFADTIDLLSHEMLFLALPTKLRIRSQSIANGFLTAGGKITAGIFLLCLGLLNAPIYIYSILLVILSAFWILAGFNRGKHYKKTFAESVGRHMLNNVTNPGVDRNKLFNASLDQSIMTLIEQSSDEEKMVILNLLPKDTGQRLQHYLTTLIKTKNKNLLVFLFNFFEEHQLYISSQLVEPLTENENSIVAAEAIAKYSQLNGENREKILEDKIHSRIIPVKSAAIASLYLAQRIPNKKFLDDYLFHLLQSDKFEAIYFITKLQNHIYDSIINEFLLDDEEAIRYEAIKYTQRQPNTLFVDSLLKNSSNLVLKLEVLQALLNLPIESLGILYAKLNGNVSEEAKELILKTLAKKGNEGSLPYLFEQMNSIDPYIAFVANQTIDLFGN